MLELTTLGSHRCRNSMRREMQEMLLPGVEGAPIPVFFPPRVGARGLSRDFRDSLTGIRQPRVASGPSGEKRGDSVRIEFRRCK